MARLLKVQEYNEKRNEILDVVQRLIYTVGYEQMTIQQILDEMKISKGAFYHYFDSKPALLQALIDRFQDQVEEVVRPIVDDRNLPALKKMDLYFSSAARWKSDRKDLLMAVLRGWYADENALVRQKMIVAGVERITPMIGSIIRQGIAEGTMTADHPDQMAEVFLALATSLGETVARLILAIESCQNEADRFAIAENIRMTIATYNTSLERIMGVSAGSVNLFGDEMMQKWLEPTA